MKSIARFMNTLPLPIVEGSAAECLPDWSAIVATRIRAGPPPATGAGRLQVRDPWILVARPDRQRDVHFLDFAALDHPSSCRILPAWGTPVLRWPRARGRHQARHKRIPETLLVRSTSMSVACAVRAHNRARCWLYPVAELWIIRLSRSET